MIGQGADETAGPVEVLGGGIQGHVAEIPGHLRHVGIDGQQGVKGGGAVTDPLDPLDGVGHVAADLAQGHDAGAVDADGAVHAPLAGILAGIGVEGRALIVGGEQILHVLHRHLPVRHQAPGDVVALRRELGPLAVPAVGVGRQIAAHEPGPGRIIDVVGVGAGAEDIPGIEGAVPVQIQMIVGDELPQVTGTHVGALGAEGVGKVKGVHAELVGGDDAGLVRHPAGDPVMAADGLHPPDLVLVVEGDAVGLIGAVLLQQGRQTLHALPCRVDIGQDQTENVLLPDAAGDVLLPPGLGLLVFHHRIRRQYPGVGGDGLGGSHAHVGLVDAGGGPDALLGVHAGAGRIAQGMLRQGDLQVAQNAFIRLFLLPGVHHDQLLHVEVAVVRPGDHGGVVVAGFLANQYGGARHRFVLPLIHLR